VTKRRREGRGVSEGEGGREEGLRRINCNDKRAGCSDRNDLGRSREGGREGEKEVTKGGG
jgi:hypothetical protein